MALRSEGQKDTADVSFHKQAEQNDQGDQLEETTTVPSDEKMIKGMIEKKMGYPQRQKVKDALTEVWQGFIGLVELRTAAATPGLAKDADAFAKVLKRVGKRLCPAMTSHSNHPQEARLLKVMRLQRTSRRLICPRMTSMCMCSSSSFGALERDALSPSHLITSNSTPQTLDLLRNDLGVQASAMPMLKTKSRRRYRRSSLFNRWANNIGPDTASTSVQHLGPEGAKYLSEALKTNTT